MWLQVLAGLFNSGYVFPMGGFLGATVKLGPWASSETWALVRGSPDKFLTHLLNCMVVVVAVAGVCANVHVL